MKPFGVLLVAHGTRDELGQQQTLEVAAQLAQRLPDAVVEPCFLELVEPTIDAGLRRCVERGVRRLTVAPLLLLSAGHAKRDIPCAVADAARHWPELSIRQAAHLGCHSRLLELSDLRFAEALANHPVVPDDQTLLLLVGRGSTDPTANAEMASFSRLRFECRPLGWIETCYTAMTRPSLAEGLQFVAGLDASKYRRIVVQPHLLFSGQLASGIAAQVRQAAAGDPAHEWLLAEPLGPHALLVEALVALIEDAD